MLRHARNSLSIFLALIPVLLGVLGANQQAEPNQPLPAQATKKMQGAPSSPAPMIGILTALDHEFSAMKALLDHPTDFDVPGSKMRYVLGQMPSSNGGTHEIVLALGDMGESLAAVHGARMLATFPTVKSVLMVGIAGGVPNPKKPDEHVRLGDIVVSDRYGVLQYDYGKQTSEKTKNGQQAKKFKVRSAPRPPSSSLLQYVRFLNIEAMEGRYPWEKHIQVGLKQRGWTRPGADHDELFETAEPDKPVKHPDDPKRRPGQPRAFQGLIASSNTLLKDPFKRDELRDEFGAKAIEMETAGVADAAWIQEVGYLGVRGICDYCDSHKNDVWQPYAAMAAAGYVRALMESMPSTSARAKTEVNLNRGVWETYFDIPAGNGNDFLPPGQRSRVHFVIDFIMRQPEKEVLHEARLFLVPRRKGTEVIELYPTGEGAMYHGGGQELGQQIERFVTQNPPFRPLTLEANLSTRIKIPSYKAIDPSILNKESDWADVLVSLQVGTKWAFLLVRTRLGGMSGSQIHREIKWGSDCSTNTLKEVLDSFGKEDTNFGAIAVGVGPL
jgi:nucleoside phosphorylase